MKKLLSIVALLVSVVAIGQTKKLHLKGSNLQWEAKKVVAGGHKGTLAFKSGELTYKNNELTGGTFVVDMNAERSEERRVGKECRSRWSPYH